MCRMYAEKHTHIDGSTHSPGEPVGRSQLVGGGSRGKQVEGGRAGPWSTASFVCYI